MLCRVKKPKKKRKRPYYIPVNKLPRILKRDIRRDYPGMYVNVLNSLDVNLMSQFFEQFATPTLTFSRYLPQAHRHNIAISRSINGVHSIASGIHEEIKDFPDFMLQIQDVKIYQKQNVSGCKIIIQSLMNGTMLIYAQTMAKVVAAAAAAEAHTNRHHHNNNKRNNRKKLLSNAENQHTSPFHPSMPSMSQLASLVQLPASFNPANMSLPALLEGLAASPVVSNFMAMFSSYGASGASSSPIVPFFHNVVTQTTFSVDEDCKIYQIEVTDQFIPMPNNEAIK